MTDLLITEVSMWPAPVRGLDNWLMRFVSRLSQPDSQDGLETMFAEAVGRHDAMIKRICFGYSRDENDLKDLYQDALVNIWQGLPRFRSESSLKTWIYRVTLNTCVSNVRGRSKELTATSIDNVVDVADNSDESRVRIRELYECISRLGPIDKAIVMLWLDEYSYDEIAEMAGLTRNNVAIRLHRAKNKLKDIMS